jgi:hypothetical protein
MQGGCRYSGFRFVGLESEIGATLNVIAVPRKQQIPPLRFAPVGMTHFYQSRYDSRSG